MKFVDTYDEYVKQGLNRISYMDVGLNFHRDSDVLDFVRGVFPCASRVERHVIVRALEQLKPLKEVLRIPWLPQMDNQDQIGTILTHCPEQWCSDIKTQWKHGVDLYSLPFIPVLGLECILSSLSDPLMTTKSSDTAYYDATERPLVLEHTGNHRTPMEQQERSVLMTTQHCWSRSIFCAYWE